MRSNNGKQWFIGIDGGGTKTRAAICDGTGQVLALASGEASNPLSRPWGEVERTLRTCIADVREQAGVSEGDVAGLYIGLGGADRPRVKAMIQNAFADSWQERLFIDNDAVAALYAGTWGRPGIVLICGTGSIAYAVSEQGTRQRVGGWGYLIGDEGSGFDLGRKAAAAVLRAYDGRGKETLLTELFLTHYGVERPDELISMIYEASNPRMALAQTSALVEQAAALGDAIAAELISQAADFLIELASTCLAKRTEPLPVVLAGGLLTAQTMLRQQLIEKAPFATVIPTVSPVIGSLVAAMTRKGCHLDEETIKQLQASGTKREEMKKVREQG
ncbi:N-acetylglucosamine kinase [Brevibacillus sp. NRS-1366]|uniref:N-acetylglucosamine kinase n=1 Tax=Brevibacillus sp. NRS-1366 TaxID=3233899 RepID=UPI003D2620AA